VARRGTPGASSVPTVSAQDFLMRFWKLIRTCAYIHDTRWFVARLIFDPEDESDVFLRNVCSRMDYMGLYPRRWQHSLRKFFTGLQYTVIVSFDAVA
jgi:hypothetical protein